jgi:hypothetical protein
VIYITQLVVFFVAPVTGDGQPALLLLLCTALLAMAIFFAL